MVPQVDSPVGGWPIGSIGDYFGLPTVGQVSAGKRVTHSALPLRAYNLANGVSKVGSRLKRDYSKNGIRKPFLADHKKKFPTN